MGAFGAGGRVVEGMIWIAALLAILFLAPPFHRWMARRRPILEPVLNPFRWQWRLSLRSGAAVGAGAVVAIYFMVSGVSEFLYFQF